MQTAKIDQSLKSKETTPLSLSLSQIIQILIIEIIVLFSFNLLLWQREFGSQKFLCQEGSHSYTFE